MSEILERAKAHFRDKVGETLNSVEVPEWGTTIYFKPASLEQQNKIYKYIREGSLESLVETIIVRALNEGGKRLFTPANRLEFMKHVDPEVISRICEAMGGDDADEEEAEKN